jgi:hypothetical protein
VSSLAEPCTAAKRTQDTLVRRCEPFRWNELGSARCVGKAKSLRPRDVRCRQHACGRQYTKKTASQRTPRNLFFYTLAIARRANRFPVLFNPNIGARRVTPAPDATRNACSSASSAASNPPSPRISSTIFTRAAVPPGTPLPPTASIHCTRRQPDGTWKPNVPVRMVFACGCLAPVQFKY